MSIRLLDPHTAELIAAGEVVERPSSVVKELCENAIDAGAKNLSVEIEQGGISLIRVSDDGAGIAKEDIPLAFVRHATSKVRTADDLEAIQTLGFRGEALASIASVARVSLLTRSADDEFANLYHIEGGGEGALEETARPRGTTIEVRDLFYNTPARMKFLKKDSSEGTFVTETVSRLALSHPEVAVRYSRDGKAVFATPGDGVLKSAVWEVLGASFARNLTPVDDASGAMQVHGLVTNPREGRASRGMQYFFINGRFVKNRTMMAALEQAYRGMSMHGKFPGAVLFLEMPLALVDVNVHPAKTEVRFANEQEVFSAVYRAVKAALMDSAGEHGHLTLSQPGGPVGTPPAAKAEEGPTPVQTAMRPAAPAKPREEAPAPRQLRAYEDMLQTTAAAADSLASTSFIPYETRQTPPLSSPPVQPAPLTDEWRLDILADEVEDEPESPVRPETSPPVAVAAEAPTRQAEPVAEPGPQPDPLRLVGEVFKTYIIAEAGETMCLIDKHAAHERILYEKIAAARGAVGSQQLLAPVHVSLSAAEKDALIHNAEALDAAGIEVEDFGGGAVLVRGVPADVEQADVEGLIIEVAGRLAVNNKDNLNSKTEWVLHSIACRTAVKAGDHTPPGQLLALAQDIMSGKVPPFCPHGRPVVLEITRKELEKQFGRLG